MSVHVGCIDLIVCIIEGKAGDTHSIWHSLLLSTIYRYKNIKMRVYNIGELCSWSLVAGVW